MGTIYVKDPYGLTHQITIAGDQPTNDEVTKINAYLTGGTTPTEKEPEQTDWDKQGLLGAFYSGTMSGANQMQAGTAGLAGLATGDQTWEAARQEQNKEAASYTSPTGGFFDQDGFYNKSKYLAYQLGQSAPATAASLPSMYAGAQAGAFVGSFGGPVGTGIGSLVGGVIGAAVPSIPQAYNENLEEQISTYGKINDPKKAFVASLGQAALEGTAERITLGVTGALGKTVPGEIKGIVSDAIKGAIPKALMKSGEGAITGFSAEAITEATQQAITRWQADKPLGDAEAQKEYLENAIVGGLLGATMGATAGTVGAVHEIRDDNKKKLIQADLDAEQTARYGTNLADNLSSVDKTYEGYAKADLDQEEKAKKEAYAASQKDALSLGPSLLAGPKTVTDTTAPMAKDVPAGTPQRPASDTPPNSSETGRPPFSEDEYMKTVNAMRGQTSFSPDKIKQTQKMGRVKAKAIFDEMFARGDAAKTGSKDQYGRIIDRKASESSTTADNVTRAYRVASIEDKDIAPYNVLLQGGKKAGPDFKTAQEAHDFAKRSGFETYVVAENPQPKRYAVYEDTTGLGGKVTSRKVRDYSEEVQAKEFLNSLNPDWSPKTNEKVEEVKRDDRIEKRVAEIVGRWQGNLQTLANTMLGKDKSYIDLVKFIASPDGNPDVLIEGYTDKKTVNGLRRIALAHGIYQPNMSADQREQAINEIAHHEIFHAAKAAGLFTPQEYNSLLRRANRKINGKNYTYVERAQVRTKGAPEGAGMEEEALAEMFRDYMRDPTNFEPASRSILQKLMDFIRSIFRLADPTIAEDIFGALSSGKLAQRGPVSREDMYGPYYSSVKIPGFYSATEDYFETIAQKNPEQAYPGIQWNNMLKNAKGVKEEELQWLGLKDWLSGQKKVSVKEILQFIAANAVDVKERVNKGYTAEESVRLTDLFNEIYEVYKDNKEGSITFNDWLKQEAADEYSPWKQDAADVYMWRTSGEATHGATTQRGGGDYTELLFHMPHLQPEFAVGGHFDGFPNILAHGRFTTRTIDGKKTLFIEEIQSDLHQRGKKKGYASKEDLAQLEKLRAERAALVEELRPFFDKDWFSMSLREQQDYLDIKRQIDLVNEDFVALQQVIEIPDAPFKTSWSDFVVKRLVRHAAENGFDAITWNAEASGVAQSEHYGDLVEITDEQGQTSYETQWGHDVTGIVNFYAKRLTNDIKKLFNKQEFGNPLPRIVPRVDATVSDLNLEELFPTYDDFAMVMQEVARTEPDMKKWAKKAQQIALNQRRFDPQAALEQAEMPIGRFADVFNDLYPEYAIDYASTATIDKAGNPNVARWMLEITPELKSTALGKGFPMFSAINLKPDESMIASPNFRRWFAGSKVVGDDGKPLVLYHGTVNDFEAFDPSRGHAAGFWGRGIYFTDNPQDASENYAGLGPDLQGKIYDATGVAMDELYDEGYTDDQVVATLGIDDDGLSHVIKGQYMQHEGAVIPAFMAIKNPFIIGGDKETQFDLGMRERLVKVIKGLESEFLNVDADKLSRDFAYNYDPEEIVSGQHIYEMATNSGALIDALDPESGMLAPPEVFRMALEEMGFDGIIQNDAGKKFYGGRQPNYTHYVAFRPTQVKSIYNNGDFSPEDARIVYSSVTMKPTYSANAAFGTRVQMRTPPKTIADIESKILYNTVAPKLEWLLHKGTFGLLNKETARNVAEGSIIGLQDAYQPLAKLIDNMRRNGGSITNETDAYLRQQLMHGEIDNHLTRNRKGLYEPFQTAIQHLNVTKANVEEIMARHPSNEVLGEDGIIRERSAVRNILNNYKDHRHALAELYLYAQHAKERNAVMRERNEALADERLQQYEAGSGMTDFEADDVLNWFASKPFAREFSDLSNPNSIRSLARKIVNNTNDIRVSGQLNPDYRKMFREDGTPVDRYSDYVPLRGYLEENPDHINDELSQAFARTGRGGKIMGKEDFSATGRRDEAANLIGNLIFQNMEAVVRAGKNKVGLSFLDMITNNMGVPLPNEYGVIPNTIKDFAEVVSMNKLKPTYDRRTGRVRMQSVSQKMDPNIMVVKRGGEEIGINIKDPKLKAAMMGQSMLGTTGQGAVIKGLLSLNRVLAAARTSYNPEFMISNLMRDLEAAALNLTEYEMKGLRSDVIKSAMPAIRGVLRSLRDNNVSDPWRTEFEEFARYGGKTAYMGIRDLESTITRISKQLEEDPGGNLRKAKDAVLAVGEYIESVNDAVENGTRVAAYKHIKDRLTAMSSDPVRDAERIRSRAALAAKNLTVNFNMGGTQKPLMQALYLFYNASIQGSFALVNPLIRSPRVRRLWLTAIAGGVLQDALMSMVSDIADDGESEYDKIPEQILQTNIILPNPFVDRGYIKIPMPYLFNSAWNAGRSFARTLRGGYTLGEGMNSIMGTVVDSMNPWGGGGSFLNYIAPTFMDPMVDLVANKNFMGSPISPPENPFVSGVEIPAQRYWNNTSPFYVGVGSLIDTLTGGDGVLPGNMSFSPNQYEYIFEWFGGGAWSTIVRSFDMVAPEAIGGAGRVQNVFSGGELSANDVPFVRRFVGNLTSREDLSKYIERRDQVLAVRNALKEAVKDGDSERYKAIMQRYPAEYKAAARVNSMEAQRRKISGMISKIRDAKNIPEADKKQKINELKQRQEALVNQANAMMDAI